MVLCFVPNCNHQSLSHECSFHRFPKSAKDKKKWEKLCRRDDRNLNDYDRICSCHFPNGKKDSGPPSIFPWSKGYAWPDIAPTKRRKLQTPTGTINTEPSNDLDHDETDEHDLPSGLHDHTYSCPIQALIDKNKELEQHMTRLEQELANLKLNVRVNPSFGVDSIIDDDKKMLMYTSLHKDTFLIINDLLERFELNYIYGWEPKTTSRKDQLFLTLMKLKLNMPHLDLAERFSTSTTTITNIIMTVIMALHEILFVAAMKGKLPSLNKCKMSRPSSFGDFTNCRIIIDATEITQDVPNLMSEQSYTYSSYKNNHTVKSVTGVAPNGTIVFVSSLYPGNTSDVKIVEHSKLLNLLEAGDLILADKGFTIHSLLPQGVSLNIPPFLRNKTQFTPEEIKLCRRIARSRIHVERANERIKNFKILDHIPSHYRAISTQIFQLCCVLVNFQDPLIKECAQE